MDFPSNKTEPDFKGFNPHNDSASSVLPDPTIPAIPTTSPACTVNDTF